MIAEGAGHYREPGWVERIGRALATIPMSRAIRHRLKRLYLKVLTIESGGQGLRATLPEGEVVRVLPDQAHLGWNPDEYRAFRQAAKPGTTALDIGANVGAYALLLGQWVGRSGAVYAFEPAPDAFDGLCRHITLNDLQTVVHPVQAAVGAVPTNGRLLLATTSGESRLATPSENETAATNVLVTTVDEFCERHRLMPSFIKVDVEGAELDVLRGARETIRRSPALALFVEIHPTIWRRIGVTRDEFLDELARQSLDVESLVPGQDPWAVEGVALRLRPRTR